MTRRGALPRVPLVAIGYALVLVGAHYWLASLRTTHRARVLMSTSTNVYHLEHDPWRVLPLSALWAQGWLALWVVGVIVCLGLLELSFGLLPTIAVAAAGHLVGTVVSEGVVALRIDAGDLPGSARHLLDVGPSYIVVACGVAVAVSPAVRRPWRILSALTLVPLTIETLDGLPSGEVDAIGHAVAAVVGAAMVFGWHRRSRQQRPVLSS